ncbi:hypothetical protein N2152v2_010249 [Parachlorella kessleri]
MAAALGQRVQLHRSSIFGTKLVSAKPQRGPGKKWEHYELTKNFKPVRIPMHVKSGDTVQVIAGSDKGVVGKITKVNTKTGTVLVEGVNIKTKHVKPTQEGEAGQIVKKEFPVHHSNVQLYSTEKQVRSRIGYKVLDDGRKVRYLKKTGEIVD